eukprot:g1569.t1
MRLRLVYFPVRAKAEAIRMAFAFGNVTYENVSPQSYFGMKWMEGAKEQTPFRQLPLLVIDDEKPIAQSGTIMRFVCSELVPELTPKESVQAARCDSLWEASQELATMPTNVNPIVNVFRGKEFEEKKQDYFKLAHAKLENLEQKHCSSESFLLGDHPYYCDLGLYHVLDNTHTLEPESLNGYPQLRSLMKRVESIESISNYLNNRPMCLDIGVNPRLSSE